MAEGRLTVLAGPSGVGKGSVVQVLRRRHPDVLVSVSWATRAPRPGEVDGEHYHFVDRHAFTAEVERGGFLEYAEYAGQLKGTPREAVTRALARGTDVLLEIDLQGARQVRAAMPEALLVFLSPPTFAELERRLASRGTEDVEEVRRRLAIAHEEMAAADSFDAVVVNDDIESAAARLVSLMRAPALPPPAYPV